MPMQLPFIAVGYTTEAFPHGEPHEAMLKATYEKSLICRQP